MEEKVSYIALAKVYDQEVFSVRWLKGNSNERFGQMENPNELSRNTRVENMVKIPVSDL